MARLEPTQASTIQRNTFVLTATNSQHKDPALRMNFCSIFENWVLMKERNLIRKR